MTPDHLKLIEAARERYAREAPEPPDGLPVGPAENYVHFKAFIYLALGPEQYRVGDALRQPPEDWPADRLLRLETACRQLVQWRGFSPATALEGLGIQGCYDLMQLLHFGLASQAAALAIEGERDVIIDRMSLAHLGERERTLTLYNRVDHRQPEPTPCPYCGAPLRTARAKQCRSCRRSWHDGGLPEG